MNETTSPSPSLSPPDRFTSPVPVPLPATPRTPPARPPMRPPQIPERPRTPPLVAEAPSGKLLAGIPIEKSIEQPWVLRENEDIRQERHDLGAPVLATAQAPVEREVPTISKRRDKVIYVRVNTEERKLIVADASSHGMSLSRYVTSKALAKRPPLDKEERQRLESLLLMFKRVEVSLSRRQCFALTDEDDEAVCAALETTRVLIRELSKRIFGHQ